MAICGRSVGCGLHPKRLAIDVTGLAQKNSGLNDGEAGGTRGDYNGQNLATFGEPGLVTRWCLDRLYDKGLSRYDGGRINHRS
jgi:hypothetical protein